MTPGNPIIGSTVLRRPAIQSPNFVQLPLAGWAINQDGSAFFANVTATGTITATSFSGTSITGVTITGSTFDGTGFIINQTGAFFYSSTPAAGNMKSSIGASANGTDAFGNHYLSDVATYSATTASQMTGSDIDFYTGTQAGGWTLKSQIVSDGSGNLSLTAGTNLSVFSNSGTLNLQSGSIPQSSAGVTTVAQVVAKLVSAGVFS